MLSFLQPRIANTRIGIEFRADGVAVAVSRSARSAPLKAAECYWLPSAPNKRLQNLGALIRSLKLKGCACDIVLPRNDYQRFELARPNVPNDELHSAAHWAVRKLIDEPVDQYRVECFDFPVDALRNRPPRIHARAARVSTLDNVRQSVQAVGLVPKSIGVSDIALKNFSLNCVADDDLQLVLKVEGGNGLLIIYKQSHLYFARDFLVPSASLLSESDMSQTLAVEVQRSIDFFEGQTGLTTPKHIHTLSDLSSARLSNIQELLGCRLGPLPLGGSLKGFDVFTDTSVIAHLSTQSALSAVCTPATARCEANE